MYGNNFFHYIGVNFSLKLLGLLSSLMVFDELNERERKRERERVRENVRKTSRFNYSTRNKGVS